MQLSVSSIIYKLMILVSAVGLTVSAVANEANLSSIEKLANEGNGFAQMGMGDFYREGSKTLNIEKDLVKSFKWYEKANKQGWVSAQNNLGHMYLNGMGVRQDYFKALDLFRKAANRNDANAQIGLGIMYWKGNGVRQNTEIAKEWFGKACDNGSQTGCDVYRILNE